MKLTKELKVFYTYAVLTPRNNRIYVGLSRQDPYKRLATMSQRIRWSPEFEDFWGLYSIALINSELNEEEAVEAEKRIIKKIREGTRYNAINKSPGGEVGYSSKRAISNDALKNYYSYLSWEVLHQRSSSFGEWKMESIPMSSTKIQFPTPTKYFKTIMECIEEVAQDFIAKHLGYVERARSGSIIATQRDELLAWLDCV